MITDESERATLPTARETQIVVDVRPLLQSLRALQRPHEDRSLPTMATVVSTIVAFAAAVRTFVDESNKLRAHTLVEFGNALLRQGESYFAGHRIHTQKTLI